MTPAPRSYANGEYPLDGLSRELGNGEVACDPVRLREYAGTRLRFTPAALSIEPFVERLQALERVIAITATRVYGRTPSAISISASYDCRPVSGNQRRLSEHALGNAIDVSGFHFKAPSSAAAPPSVTGFHFETTSKAAAPSSVTASSAAAPPSLTGFHFETVFNAAAPLSVTGFRFDTPSKAAAPPSALTDPNASRSPPPPELQLPDVFEVRVKDHWKANADPLAQQHARFLHELTQSLIEHNVFRTLLGPSHPNHADHFHFDMAPWDYVNL